jgi:beta-mannosidase
VDLAGTWRATAADESLRRACPDPDFDDAGWAELEVPGHWRSSPSFESSDGPLWYRRRFEGGGPDADVEGGRAWLVLDGVFYQSDVWLDGSYVGDTEGYFFPHAFEVTSFLRDRAEHVLAVEVACGRAGEPSAKRNITGAFQTGGNDWNPGGIWRGVRVEHTGPVRISRLRALCLEATPERAVVALRAVLDCAAATTVRLRTRIGGADHELEQPVAAGENRVTWNVPVESPALWWPWALGAQPLTELSVEAFAGDDPAPSHCRRLATGLRQVRMKSFVLSVNGERLFLKGANVEPLRLDLAAAEQPDFERDVLLARDAGLDLLRVRAHVSRPELYDAADRHGLLLWQDFPLYQGYARGIRKQAAAQAREAVDLLGHHPSIALWCGHHEPVDLASARPTVVGYLAQADRPTWNKTLLDAAVHRAFERTDASRPSLPHSGVDDTHLYFGGRYGDGRDLAGFLARWPRLGRFVSEVGAPEGPEQAEVVRRSIETLRRLKYRPTGGLAVYALADGRPDSNGWGALAFDRSPRPAWDALQAACWPVIVVADAVPVHVVGGEAVALDEHVVSDLRAALDEAVVRARLTWAVGPGGSEEWAWTGAIPADSCVRVGTIQFVVPEGVGAGDLRLDLDLRAGDVTAANAY